MGHAVMHRNSLFLAMVMLSACRPSVPPELKYRVHFAPADVVPGLELQRDGASVGALSAAGDLEFTVPSTVRPTKLALTALLPSPCGPVSAALVLDTAPHMDEDRRVADQMKREGVLRVSAKLPATRRFPLLIDRGVGTLDVGAASIPTTAAQFALFEKPGCAPTAPVKAGGETIGTWRASSPVTFISVPDTCHRAATVTFGDAVGGNSLVMRQRVRALDAVPDFFLKKAPASVASKGGSARYMKELTATECPPGPAPAEVARKAMAHGGCFEAVPSLTRAVAWNDEDLESTVQLVTCLARSYSVREATVVAQAMLARQPEVREQLQQAFVAAEHSEVTLAP